MDVVQRPASSVRTSRCQFDYRIASNDPNATIFDGKVDPDAKPFQQDEFTVGFQHELSRNYVIGSRFVYKDVNRRSRMLVSATTKAAKLTFSEIRVQVSTFRFSSSLVTPS